MIQAEVITNTNDIHMYKGIWDELYDSSKCEASTSFEWTYGLLTTHVKKNDSFILILLRDSGTIVGILPLVVYERKKFGQKLTTLMPISEYYNTHGDFLLHKMDDDLLEVLADALFNMEQQWDIFRMGNLLESNQFLPYLVAWLEKSSFKYKIIQQDPSFFIQLDTTYDDYLKKRSSKFRNYLRRMEKKLSSQGDLIYTTESNFSDIFDAYKYLLEIEEKSWKHSHGTAISAITLQEDFYRTLINGAFSKGRLHLHFLFLNNEPIAYNLGLIKDQTYLYLKTSYVESYRKFGPSTVLRAKLIQMLIDSGIKYFDFAGGEPYEWEKQWTKELKLHKSLLVFNKTFKANLFFLYQVLKQLRAGRQPAGLIKYYNPRAFKPPKP